MKGPNSPPDASRCPAASCSICPLGKRFLWHIERSPLKHRRNHATDTFRLAIIRSTRASVYFPRSILVQRCFPIDTFEILNELQTAADSIDRKFSATTEIESTSSMENCQLENNVISRKIAEENFRVSRVRWLIDHVLHREAKRSLKNRAAGWQQMRDGVVELAPSFVNWWSRYVLHIYRRPERHRSFENERFARSCLSDLLT